MIKCCLLQLSTGQQQTSGGGDDFNASGDSCEVNSPKRSQFMSPDTATWFSNLQKTLEQACKSSDMLMKNTSVCFIIFLYHKMCCEINHLSLRFFFLQI